MEETGVHWTTYFMMGVFLLIMIALVVYGIRTKVSQTDLDKDILDGHGDLSNRALDPKSRRTKAD